MSISKTRHVKARETHAAMHANVDYVEKAFRQIGDALQEVLSTTPEEDVGQLVVVYGAITD